MSFHSLSSQTLAGGALSIAVSPALTARCTTEADGWNWYRVKALKFRILALTGPCAAGFVEGKPDTQPSTIATVGELLDSVLHGGSTEFVWSRWVEVPKIALAGALPWYKTIPGAATDEEELSGLLVFGGTTTNGLLLDVFFTFEFKGPVSTTNTPLQVELQLKLHEERRRIHAAKQRDGLLTLLAKPPTGGTRGT
jgi:hypothetical protein